MQPKRFHGATKEGSGGNIDTTTDQLVFVEIFAGSAKLSSAASNRGFKAVSVDHPGNRHRPQHEILLMDLTDSSAQSQLLQTLEEQVPGACHMAPPCGTCSRAREKPLPELGQSAPQPLRDEHNLFGFANLTGTDKLRVQQSNILYSFVVEVLYFCFLHGVIVSLENPANSWLWAILKELVVAHHDKHFRIWFQQLSPVTFSNCAWGGERPKSTRWLSTPKVFESLERECPGESDSHVHKPYVAIKTNKGMHFSTSEEAEYPHELCVAAIQAIAKALKYPDNMSTSHPKTQAMASAHRQHRRHPPLIPEFATFVTMSPAPSLPHKLLDHRSSSGGAIGSDRELARYGIYHTKLEFFTKSMQVAHPFDTFATVDSLSKQNIHSMLTRGHIAICRERLKALVQCEKLAKQMDEEEKQWKVTLPVHMREVLEGKRVLLWEALLRQHGYQDLAVVDFMKSGVDLVGKHVPSPLMPEQMVRATTSPELLARSSVWRNKSFSASPIHKDDPDMAQQLYQVTMDEVGRGFLKGPYDSLEQIRSEFGLEHVVVNRRFLLLQGEANKPRAIDDCKSSGVNNAITQNNKLVLQDIDSFVSLAAYVGSCIRGGKVVMSPSETETKPLDLHPDFGESISWKGKCLDLEKAYRQVPVSHSSLAYSVALVHTVEGVPRYFISQSLPFGACSSVYAFNRISASIKFLVQKLLGGILTVFYDDFPLLEPSVSAELFDQMMSKFLTILGWHHATTGKKGLSYAEAFDVLGATVELSKLQSGHLEVRNKVGRLERIQRLINEAKKTFPPKKHDMQVIAGLLQYATGNSLGVTLRLCSRACSSLSAGRCPCTAQEFSDLCDWMCRVIGLVQPRVIDLAIKTKPLLVFKDASWDGSVARWGFVVTDPLDDTRLVFGGQIPDVLVQHWLRQVGQQIICEAEIFAAVLARWYLNTKYTNRRCIFWIDNDAARLALIKSVSTSVPMLCMAQSFHAFSETDNIQCWFERVASESNIADLPSRQQSAEAAKLIKGAVADLAIPDSLVNALLDDAVLGPCISLFSESFIQVDVNWGDTGRM